MVNLHKKINIISYLLLTTLLIALLSACSPRSALVPGQETDIGTTTFSADKGIYPPTSGLFPSYSLTPGDVLDVLFQIKTLHEVEKYIITANDTLTIKFVQLPDLNETQRVRPDGKITLAYVGDVSVINQSPGQLQDNLKKKYSKFLRDPQLYVTVDEFRERIKELKKDLHTASRGLSRLVTVRPDGYATFPMLGDLMVSNKSMQQVKKELDTFYKSYLKGLHVDLFLQDHAGSTVYVLGQVLKPGSYKINKPITIFQALALAQGATPEASLDDIMVFRRKGNQFKSTVANLAKAMSSPTGGDFFYLMPDDIVYVAESGVYEASRMSEAISQIIMFRGWGISFGGDTFGISN
ncbi:polysaccharide biosynthesis/export family protein [Maridesulfovibrio frigidus]|uniref:polysaccharide biosynthesis/export family protein n=1 Tax=Maridesulfovibrio frigidus TaxID=340956 RepID=UPI00068AD8AD|nr:polysaccharide biosynthesis/export family protein [Maridesulfovibrio frigidus]